MDRVQVELRGHIDKDIIDVLDAVSMARGVTRIDIAEQVLRQWANERVHESMLVARITRGNGSEPEAPGAGTENSVGRGNPGGRGR